MKSDYCQNEKDGNLLVGGYYCVDIIIGLYSLFHSPTGFRLSHFGSSHSSHLLSPHTLIT